MQGHESSEIVWGAEAIGKVVGLTARKAFYLLERGYLPGKKGSVGGGARRGASYALRSSRDRRSGDVSSIVSAAALRQATVSWQRERNEELGIWPVDPWRWLVPRPPLRIVVPESAKIWRPGDDKIRHAEAAPRPFHQLRFQTCATDPFRPGDNIPLMREEKNRRPATERELWFFFQDKAIAEAVAAGGSIDDGRRLTRGFNNSKGKPSRLTSAARMKMMRLPSRLLAPRR
jgi:hypothetical protein